MKKEITNDVFFCDRCDKEIEEEVDGPVRSCVICGKDLCHACLNILQVRGKTGGVKIYFPVCATPSHPAGAFPEGYHQDAGLHAQNLLPDITKWFCESMRAAEEQIKC